MLTSLRILPIDLQALTRQAEQLYPHECCGLLVGYVDQAGAVAIVVEVYPLENVWTSTSAARFAESAGIVHLPPSEAAGTERRYTIDPQQMLAIQKLAHTRELAIVGIYHSHPDHPALPSEYDRQLAWAEYVYPIISVCQGQCVDVQAWQLDANQQFQAVTIELAILDEVRSQ